MLKLGYDPDFAPLSYRDAAGQARGEAIEILAAAARAACIGIVFVPVTIAEQVEALATGRVEALAAVADTPQRREAFELSVPFIETGASWFSSVPFDPDSAPAGTPVVSPAGGPLVALIGRRWPHLAMLDCEGYADALGAVAAGRAQAAALNSDAGWLRAETLHPGVFRRPASPFLRLGLAAAAPKGAAGPAFRDLCSAIRARNAGAGKTGPST